MPQLFASFWRSVQISPQQLKPAGQHDPPQQAWPGAQHSTPPQQVWPAGQQRPSQRSAHDPPQQVCPGPQATQVSPSVPQKLLVVPPQQLPLASQQPLQLAELQSGGKQ
jgi:hypothetical protein